MFTVYMIHHQPFLDPVENRMQVLNETCFLMVSELYFCFTDFNPDPRVKVYCGWVLILMVILNLIYPNFTHMSSGIWPDIRNIFSKKTLKRRRGNALKALEKARKKLLENKEFKKKFILKKEFREQLGADEMVYPRANQVSALETYPSEFNNIYEQKEAYDK